MASVTQTIPQFSLGMSEQPDNLKFPGQVTDIVNAIPDVTRGLYKRPGAKRIGTSPLSNVQSEGSWFHYYRDEKEGSYIGQVDTDGEVRIWRCSDGQQMTTVYGTGGEVAIKKYLTRKVSAKYTRSGNTITVNTFPEQHGLKVGDKRTFDFTGGGTDGEYTVVAASTTNTYTDSVNPLIVYGDLGLVSISGLSATQKDIRVGHQITAASGLDNNVTINTPATITNISQAGSLHLLELDKKNGGTFGSNSLASSISITISNPFEFTVTDSASGTITENDCTYIATDTDEELQFLTINDTTFVNNRNTENPNTLTRVNKKCTYSIPAAPSGNAGVVLATINLVDHGLAVGDEFDVQVLSEDISNGENLTSLTAQIQSGSLKITHDGFIGLSSSTTPDIAWIDDDTINIQIYVPSSWTAKSGILLFERRSQGTPDPHFAMVEVLRTENGRQYGLDIFNTSTVTTLTRATRVSIVEDTLDESNGTGTCPGIGTQVFSVDHAADYTGTPILKVGTNYGSQKIIPVSPNTISTGANSITATNHGFITGEKVRYSQELGGAVNGWADGNAFFVIKVDDNNLKLASSVANATAGTPVAFSNLTSNGDIILTSEGTQNLAAPYTRKNLIFRLHIMGQQGVSPTYNANANGPGGNNYRCSYHREVILLHGGEGWQVGDVVSVVLDSANGGGASESVNDGNAAYKIRVDEIETTELNVTVLSDGDGLVRPEPTPFDAQTAVTVDTIIGGIVEELPPSINGKQIGNGLYLSSQNSFTVNVVEQDLMRVMQSSVNNVQGLPNQCKHGYIAKVSNALRSEEDDYYLKFEGENDKDGSGAWVECAKPGIPTTFSNMPLVIQRTAIDTFTVKFFDYGTRTVGDDTTNPLPSFVGKRLNKVLFFRNRLALLAGENVITSRPGSLGEPDFFIETALTVSVADPVDISASSMFPSDLFDGIEINAGLLVFSTNQQFLLASDDTVFNPDTAKFRSIAAFNYNENISPISLGTTIAYIDNSGKFSRFNEMANSAREGEPNVIEVSKVVPTLLPKDIDLITNSRENSIVLISKTGTDTVFGYKYFQTAEKRIQAAWFKWKLNNPLQYHFIVNDEYFFLDTDYYLQSIKLIQAESDPSIVQDNVDFLLHVDNHTTISGGSYNSTTNITTFSGVSWLSTVTTPNHDLVLIDTNANSVRVGRYAKPTVSGTSFTVPGNWSNATLTIGYIYPYQVSIPTLYPTKVDGPRSTADVNSSLVLHRIKFHFGKIGLYETTLERIGKPDYTEVYESTQLDEYNVSDAPYLEEFIKNIPVYEKNTNVEITLKSSHPAPATLRSLSWEGDYSPKYYRRV